MVRVSVLITYTFLVVIGQQQCFANPFLAAKEVLDFVIDVCDQIEKIYKFVEGDFLTHGQDNLTESNEKDVVELEIYKKLDLLSTDFQDLRDRILDKITNNLRNKLTEKTDELFKYTKDVQRVYKIFLDFFKNADKYESTELKSFAEVTTSFSLVELRTIIEKMHEALVDPDIRKDSIISIIGKDSSAADTICIRGESGQQLIKDLYEAVALTDAKGLFVTLYSYELKEKFENRTYEYRKNTEINNYAERVKETFVKVREALASASREVWRCDPAEHKKDQTYTKLEEVFQGYFMYEPDTTHNNWHAAIHTCAALTDDRLRCKSAPCKAQPKDRRCTGHLRDCQSIAHYMQICHSPTGSDRRYEWMKTGAGTLFGRDGPCDRTQGLWDIPPYLISNCFCNCESEQRNSDRFFSLQNVTSDIDDNKVVTGARLIKRDHVIHIQIQQGILGGNGSIISEPKWKDINVIPISELLSDNVSTHHFVIKSQPWENDDRELKYDEWVEFHKNDLVYAVTYNQNTVYLDDLDSRSNELLTGLRFQQINNHLRFEIQTTPFDYATGKLQKDETSWSARSNTVKNRQEVVLSDPDDPSRWVGSDVFSHNNQFVRFKITDIKRDLGQNTVPFIDLQEVITHPPLPISGAGLFHKGKLHSGGFLSLKLIHYDFTPHL